MKRGNKYPSGEGKAAELREGPAAPVPETESMIRTQIYLSRPEYDFVQSEAAQRKEPMAAVIRSYIDEKMQLPDEAWADNPMLKPTPRDPKLDLPEDAAINHDHYLYGTPKKYAKVKGKWVLLEAKGTRR
ncbi:MAG TPA: hypothetical protein VI454_02555 [Verrucomicrobiae bacterium]|jgi:hypothetical protein